MRTSQPHILYPAVCIAAITLLFLWYLKPAALETREDRMRHALRVIRTALDRYAAAHDGDYPASEQITGSPRTDVLLRGRYLFSYPPNPFLKNRPMKNHCVFRTGDFCYQRAGKPYNFHLKGYGAGRNSGAGRDGIAATSDRI